MRKLSCISSRATNRKRSGLHGKYGRYLVVGHFKLLNNRRTPWLVPSLPKGTCHGVFKLFLIRPAGLSRAKPRDAAGLNAKREFSN